MIRFLADECLNDNIIRGLLRETSIDFVRARDVGLTKVNDSTVLAWAADHGRVVVTHDSRTMTSHAYDRIAQGQIMPGILIVPADLGVGAAINEILLIHQLAVPEDFKGQVRYLPLA